MNEYYLHMNILIASDKYKGSMTAHQVCAAIAGGILQSHPNAHITQLPMADGGDGTMEILSQSLSLETVERDTIDPLGRPITAKYYHTADTAYIELAEASGIALLHSAELNPMITDCRGTGILIKDALSRGIEHIILGLGGSCTTEAGLSIAAELGYQFLDDHGQLVSPTGGNLMTIQSIVPPEISKLKKLTLLCDVENPMYGPNGAAYVFGPQKGATPEEVEILDRSLKHIATLLQEATGRDPQNIVGGGAAGAIAAGLGVLYDAEIKSGFDYLAELFQLEEQIKDADLIISGEGLLDAQSLQGKVVGSIATLCHQYRKPLIVYCGDSRLSADQIEDAHIHSVETVMSRAVDLRDAMENGERFLWEMGKNLSFSPQ